MSVRAVALVVSLYHSIIMSPRFGRWFLVEKGFVCLLGKSS